MPSTSLPEADSSSDSVTEMSWTPSLRSRARPFPAALTGLTREPMEPGPGEPERIRAGDVAWARNSKAMRLVIVRILLVLALAVAGATAVAILTLPDSGAVRYEPEHPNSALRQLRRTLRLVGIEPSPETMQRVLTNERKLASFRAPTYWSAQAISTRRGDYLGAGGIVVFALLASAAIVGRAPGGRST